MRGASCLVGGTAARRGQEAQQQAHGPAGDHPRLVRRGGGELVEERRGCRPAWERDCRGLQFVEDRRLASTHVARQVERALSDGDEVELGRDERLEDGLVAALQRVEERLVAPKAFDAALLEAEGALELQADLVGFRHRWNEDGRRDQPEPGQHEEPSGVEQGLEESGRHCRGIGARGSEGANAGQAGRRDGLRERRTILVACHEMSA